MYSMWNISSLKTRAKSVLKLNYWKAFIVSLVVAITGGGSSGGGSNTAIDLMDEYTGGSSPFNEDMAIRGMSVVIIIAVIAVAFMMLRLLVGYAFEIGGRKFFIRSSEGEIDMSYLSYGFKNQRYGNIFKTMFTRDVYLFLWTLLFIIPGIIKTYSYRMVPYILSDNPEIDRKRAIELSNEMTKGQKSELFLLDLSFLGWYLLGTLLFVVGILFVAPYKDSTDAEVYLVLRENALKSGLTNKDELNINDEYR